MRYPKHAHPAGLLALALAVWGASAASADPPSPFTEEALPRGLDFPMSPYPQVQGYVGQGAGFVDLDADGDADVIVIGRTDGRIGVFENIGGTFVDHTPTSGIPTLQQQEAFAAADYDADGFIDLYITQSLNRPNYLMRNNAGSFTFTNVTLTAGVGNGPQTSMAASWADYDADGWPDLYVCNYGQAKALYRNNGNGTFTNVAPALGVSAPTSLSFLGVWTDYDRDGDVDLYLSNDRGALDFPPNQLWRNDGGTFTDVSALSGADVAIFSMGIGVGDVDDNLYPDLYVTNIYSVDSSGTPFPYLGANPLLLNQGDGTFVDVAEAWNVDNLITSWAAIFFDYDNDGYKDLYVNNQFEPNSFFRCTGTPACVEMAETLGIRASFDPVYDLEKDLPEIASFHSAVGDVEGDGDLDLLVNNLGYRAELFINHEGDDQGWVRYDIVGQHPNRNAIGASVLTTAQGKTQLHEVYAGGNGYLGQNELIVTVGLGAAGAVDEAVVRWPSVGGPGDGPTRALVGLPGGQTWKIYPPSRLCDADGDGVDHDDFVAFSDCFVAGFSPGCEMMDHDGDSGIHADDLAACFVDVPADCNGNGTEDVAEIVLDLGIDADLNLAIDCCEGGTPDDPHPVGDTLRLAKGGAFQPLLSWTAPPTDPTHGAATSYDVFRASAAQGPFGFAANVAAPAYADSGASADRVFYLVGARNGCGSSGEEPF